MSGSTPRAPIPDGRALGTDRFTIERQLGEGSMGAVYLAYDRERHIRVALKTLRRVDASGIYRFKREFRALADVAHPNLVRLYELFSEGTEWFFTMEYIEGQDLTAYVLGESIATMDFGPANSTRQLRGGAGRAPGMKVLFPSPCHDPDKLRDVLAQVTRALMAVHGAGKLHRDLKPDNVMVTSEGRAVVLDFGIAFERHQEADATMEAGVMGTPAYMSPEQAAGLPVTEATDFYSLGVILYELLTGQVPFDGSYREVLRLKQRVDPSPPSELVDGVPDDLNVLCVRLLSRDQDDRPTGEELLEALGREVDAQGRTGTGVHDSSPPLLGRSGELTALERALAATGEGAPVVAMVHSLTGMGKTALVEHFLSEVRRDAQTIVLPGRCYEHEMVPFKALDSVIDALSRYLGRLSPAEAAEVMPKDVHALAQLFPVLKRVDAVRTARRRLQLSLDPRSLRRQAAGALKELLARIAMRQPLVVFIDDLHWGDQDSARLLTDLMTGEERPAMLLVCTYRSPDRERSPCLQTFLAGMREQGQTEVRDVELKELSERDAARLAFELLGISPADPEEIAREAKGSPYLVGQLVDHLRAERANLPAERDSDTRVSLDRALSDRVDALSPAARTVLELVAVSGRPVREGVIASLAAEGMELGDALSELRSHKLVRGVGGSSDGRAIGIYHDSIRDSVLGLMSPDQVRNWHRRLATALENSDAPDLEALTEHLLGSEDYSRAGIYAIRAASHAMETLAFDKAADLYAIAVEHHEDEAWRQELVLSWAEALVHAGRSTRAAHVYRKAADAAMGREAAELQRKAGVQLMLAGRRLEGREVLDGGALDDLEMKLPESPNELETAMELDSALRQRGFALAEKKAQDVDREALARVDALHQLSQATLAMDPLLSQVFAIEELRHALDAGDRSRAVVALCAHFVSVDLAFCTIAGTKAKGLQRAEQMARDLDDPRARAAIAFARAFNYQNEGLLQPARMEFAQAEELYRDHVRGGVAEMRCCRMLYARVLAMLAQWDDLARCDAWIREADECEDLVTATRLRMIGVPRMLMEGNLDAAERALQTPEPLVGPQADLTELLRVFGAVAVVLYRDDPEAAEELILAANGIDSSPLFALRLWRSDHLVNRARLFLLASRGAADPEGRLSEAQKCIETIEMLALECQMDHARILRAGLFNRRDDTQAALHELNTILSDADMGGDSRIIRACARMRKGQLLGGDEGAMMVKESERELSSWGAKDPARIARVYSPGFDVAAQRLRIVAAN